MSFLRDTGNIFQVLGSKESLEEIFKELKSLSKLNVLAISWVFGQLYI